MNFLWKGQKIKYFIVKRDYEVYNTEYNFDEIKIAMMFEALWQDEKYKRFDDLYDFRTQDFGYEEICDIVSSVYNAWYYQINGYGEVEDSISISSDESTNSETYAERVLPLFIEEYFKKGGE